MSEYLIYAKDICKRYSFGDVDIDVLKNIEIGFKKGEFSVIMGESGSGKSTLLHILGTIETPSSGSLDIYGDDTAKMDDRRKALLRRKKIGFIFQSFYLIPGLTVYENVMMPNLLDGRIVDHELLNGLLERMGLLHRKDHRPMQLSGGEQQRAAIARALANRPGILMADEPTGNLDSDNSRRIMELLYDINREDDVTVIMVTHSRELVTGFSRIINIKDGVLV